MKLIASWDPVKDALRFEEVLKAAGWTFKEHAGKAGRYWRKGMWLDYAGAYDHFVKTGELEVGVA